VRGYIVPVMHALSCTCAVLQLPKFDPMTPNSKNHFTLTPSRLSSSILKVTPANRDALGPALLAKVLAALDAARPPTPLEAQLRAKRVLAERYWSEEAVAATSASAAAATAAAPAPIAAASAPNSAPAAAPPPAPPAAAGVASGAPAAAAAASAQAATAASASGRRVAFESFSVAFRGDHGTYAVRKEGAGRPVTCSCPFFAESAKAAAAGETRGGGGTCSHITTLKMMLVE